MCQKKQDGRRYFSFFIYDVLYATGYRNNNAKLHFTVSVYCMSLQKQKYHFRPYILTYILHGAEPFLRS